VIPCPDEEAGEVPKAFVVPRSETTPEELMDFVAQRVAPHKKIRSVEFIDKIPKSASGKILRRLLVQMERERKKH
jgi:acyl-coenzyme A synthetase/AMP-(fatty) acid ligase